MTSYPGKSRRCDLVCSLAAIFCFRGHFVLNWAKSRLLLTVSKQKDHRYSFLCRNYYIEMSLYIESPSAKYIHLKSFALDSVTNQVFKFPLPEDIPMGSLLSVPEVPRLFQQGFWQRLNVHSRNLFPDFGSFLGWHPYCNHPTYGPTLWRSLWRCAPLIQKLESIRGPEHTNWR